MANTLSQVYSPLPSPPLSPATQINNQLPSPPLSPISLPELSLPFECNDEIDLEYDDDEFDFTEREIEYLESFLGTPIERPNEKISAAAAVNTTENPNTTTAIAVTPEITKDTMMTKDECLRNKYLRMIEEGVEINGEMTPYLYAIERLHSIGGQVINKKTSDAVPLRVYNTGKDDAFEEFWVHPLFLSLQSFQFFKLFEEIRNSGSSKEGSPEQQEEVIEIEVPSLRSFAFVLYYLYTGNNAKLFEIAKLDESFCKGIMENIECLEINMAAY